MVSSPYFYPRPPRGGRRRAASSMIWSLSFLSTPSARRATRTIRQSSSASIFLSTPSARRATPGKTVKIRPGTKFLSTPSARRATYGRIKDAEAEFISIHALREEGDVRRLSMAFSAWAFLSTPSARRATRNDGDRSHCGRRISIHALREEGDLLDVFRPEQQADFYPRPPRGGRLPTPPRH